MDHPDRIGPYAIQRLLGEGGSAWVYQAYDPRLERRVALKVLKLPTPEWVARLRHEAQLQARLHHPHLLPVHEVGEADGRVYLAMQFIQGRTLSGGASAFDVDTRLRLMVKVADAVHAAHRQGLIHRDLKPANILVAQDEAGQPWPYVVDFGLARLWEGQSLTAPGQMVGSPAYMAPEQAQGGSVDPRTDVYGLGATLYELITGRPPFQGQDAVSILLKVVREEPVRLGAYLGAEAVALPWGLEAVVATCLAKDPAGRYPSAAHLRDDLQRLVDGEPVLARKASWRQRGRAWMRAHRALAGMAALSLCLLLGLGGSLVRTRIQGAREARLAEELGRQVSTLQGDLEHAYLLPPHDVAPDRARQIRALENLQRRDLPSGRAFEGLRALSLGLGYLALEDPRRAKPHLEQAWNLGRQDTGTALALGLVDASLYREALPTLDPRNAQARTELETSLRTPAVQRLAQVRDQAGPWPADYVEAVLAACEARWEASLARLQAVLRQDPAFYRASQLEGEVRLLMALDHLRAGRPAEATAAIDAAERAFGACLQVARAYPRALAGLAACWDRRADVMVNLGTGDPNTLERSGVVAFERAIAADTGAAAPRAGLAHFRIQLANRLSLQGREPFAQMGAARTSALEALALEPDRPDIVRSAVYATMMLGAARFDWGQDPRAELEEAVRLGQAFLATRSDDGIMAHLTTCHTGLALFAAQSGRDATALFERFRDHARKAVAAYPRAGTFRSLGQGLHEWALAVFRHGGDPLPLLAEAEEALSKGLAANPKSLGIKTVLADVWLLRGRAAARAQQDPGPSWTEAARRVAECLAVDATSGEARHVAFGLALARADADPAGPWLAEAERRALQETQDQPTYPRAWLDLAQVRERQAVPGTRGLTRLEEARRCREKADILARGEPRATLELAQLLVRIIDLKGGPRAAAAERARALALLDRLVALNPEHAEALALRKVLA